MNTLEEQERAAYMAGDTRTAELLAQLIDAQAEIESQALTHDKALDDAFEQGYAEGHRDAQE